MNAKRRSAGEEGHHLNWLLAIFVIAILLALLVPSASAANWWRREIAITNDCGNVLTDYQVKVTLSGADDYTNMDGNGDSIRFTDIPDSIKYDYWIESWNDNGDSIIWVEVPSVPSGTPKMYLWSKDSGPSAESSGTATFPFFDDFESYADGSNIDGQGGWATKRIGGTGYAKVDTKNGKKHLCVSSTSEGTAVVHAYSSSGGLCLGSRAYRESSAAEAYSPGFGDGSVGTSGIMPNGYLTIWYGWGGSPSTISRMVSGAYTQLATASGTSAQGTHYLFDFVWDGSSLKSYRDGTLKLSGTDNIFNSQTHVHLSSWGTSIWDTDWIFIRKYATIEPATLVGAASDAGSLDPVPELPTLILFSVGLVVLAGYVLLRKRRG